MGWDQVVGGVGPIVVYVVVAMSVGVVMVVVVMVVVVVVWCGGVGGSVYMC